MDSEAEDFHTQVGDGKVRTSLYKVRKDTTRKTPITHLQGYTTMVKSLKKSHAKAKCHVRVIR